MSDQPNQAESVAQPATVATPPLLSGVAPARAGSSDTLVQRRAVALAEIVLCSSVPTQLAIALILRFAGWTPLDETGQLSLRYVMALSLADFLLLLALMVGLTRAHGDSAVELWLGHRPPGREALVGVALIPAIFLVAVVLMNSLRVIAPGLHNVTDNPLEHLARTPAQAALFGLVAIFAGGVREELQRAFLLRRFDDLGGPIVGVILLSVGFGIGHIVQGWDAVLTTGAMGAFWAVIYLRRGSAIAPVVSHAGFNSLEILRVLAGGQ